MKQLDKPSYGAPSDLGYAAFLESKRVTVQDAGIDMSQDALNPQLFPFQRDIVQWALKRGRAAIFSDCGCVAGETMLQGPNGAERIDLLAAKGQPIRVWSLSPEGETIPAWASAPFLKGVASLFRFHLASGRTITVTDDHLFLTPDGWRYASTLHAGAQIFASSQSTRDCAGDGVSLDLPPRSLREPREEVGRGHPCASELRSSYVASLGRADGAEWLSLLQESAAAPQASNLGRGPLGSLAGDPHCGGRPEDSPRRCSADSCLDGGRPLPVSNTGLAPSPLRAGAHGHSRPSSRMDGLEHRSERTRPDQGIGHPSMMDSPPPAYCADRDVEYHASSLQPISHSSRRRGGQQSVACANLDPLDGELRLHQQGSEAVQFEALNTLLDTVVAINYIRTDAYYDLHVPMFNNYLANGVWNHNTGKTPMQLEWARHINRETARPVLILAPLAVSLQTKREGEKFGIPVTVCRDQTGIELGVNVTNYEMLHHFDAAAFGGLVLDESSILKAFDGTYRKAITAFASQIDYRLACTATPAPNDLIEIINHAEYLSIMRGKEIIALYFAQDGNTTHKWRLKGHARQAFWSWLATWSVALRAPSDLGYDDGAFILPPLSIEQHTTEAAAAEGRLFPVEAQTLQERLQARRDSIEQRVATAAALVNESDEAWLVWCNLNAESDALARAIPDAIEVRGSDSREHKEDALLGFSEGRYRVLVSKPSIAGHGMNWQHCHNMAFVGLSDSWEQWYQAIRRCWRLGQTDPVTAHVIVAETEGAVVENIQRKESQAAEMMDSIVSHMRGLQLHRSTRNEMNYTEDTATGKGWTLHLGDTIDMMDRIETESIGLTVTSPPFPGMYAYTNSMRDLGNTRNVDEMLEHFRFVVAPDKLLRITMPGRMACFHLTQSPLFKSVDGFVGLADFRGRVIQMMQEAGWIYYGEVTIDKNPQLKAQRTKERGLLFKTLATDSSHMRMAMADYLLYFRKPGENPRPIRAGSSARYGNENGWITNDEWIEWAAPVWYRKTEHYPGGIRETDVLPVAPAREADDEKHLAPLQLGVIERAVKLWSAPDDLVFDPFTGIGSVGFEALRLGRRFVGTELKASYWRHAAENLHRAEQDKEQPSLFDVADDMAEAAV